MGKEFITKDSGERRSFESGAVRDVPVGKPRYDLIPPLALKRLALLYARGAEKYSEWNWSKGMNYSVFLASANRHFMQFCMGEEDEDHLAGTVFNLLSIMHFQELGREDLNDLYPWKNENIDKHN